MRLTVYVLQPLQVTAVSGDHQVDHKVVVVVIGRTAMLNRIYSRKHLNLLRLCPHANIRRLV